MRAERERFHDVGAAPDPAVYQKRRPTVERGGHFGQGARGGQRGVELPAPVVGDDHTGRAVLESQRRVVAAHDSLHENREPRD